MRVWTESFTLAFFSWSLSILSQNHIHVHAYIIHEERNCPYMVKPNSVISLMISKEAKCANWKIWSIWRGWGIVSKYLWDSFFSNKSWEYLLYTLLQVCVMVWAHACPFVSFFCVQVTSILVAFPWGKVYYNPKVRIGILLLHIFKSCLNHNLSFVRPRTIRLSHLLHI